MKVVIPELNEPISSAKYIGPYLAESLSNFGIDTCFDLVQFFMVNFSHGQEQLMRNECKLFLRNLLINDRPLQCTFDNTRIINGAERGYHIRYTNQYGYNAILNIWRHYIPYPHSLKIPRKFRGKSERMKYPLLCQM
jgi:hypothetical protein